jgi:hypothetical protein
MATIVDIGGEARRTILRQIGNINVAAISGGRVVALPDGIDLPAGSGFHVIVTLDIASDTYTVKRVYRRAGRDFDHGSRTYVHCEDVGEFAYRASCFRSYADGEWQRAS